MAIIEMQKLSICAAKKNRKHILETLQTMGCMEMSTVPTEEFEDGEFNIMDTNAQRAQFEKNAQMFDQVLKVLDEYAPEKKAGLSLFAGKATFLHLIHLYANTLPPFATFVNT